MSQSPILFSATGALQTYAVPATGSYVIEAAGAQGGSGGGPGGRGARVKGTFYLNRGDILQIVAGLQGTAGTTPHQPAGGGGGGSFVWKGATSRPLPEKPMLAAGGGGGGDGGEGRAGVDGGDGAAPGGRNGQGGESDPANFHYSGGGGAGWLSGGDVGSTPTLCGGGTLWRGGAGANYCCNLGGTGGFGGGGGGAFIGNGSGGGGGFSGGGGGTQLGLGGGGGGSFNAGANPTNTPGFQTGDGCVTILPIPAPTPFPLSNSFNPFGTPAFDAAGIEPAGESQRALGGLEGKGYM